MKMEFLQSLGRCLLTPSKSSSKAWLSEIKQEEKHLMRNFLVKQVCGFLLLFLLLFEKWWFAETWGQVFYLEVGSQLLAATTQVGIWAM